MRFHILTASVFLIATVALTAQQASTMPSNPFLSLMITARAHAQAHGASTPTLSPAYSTLLGENPPVNVAQLHHAGFRVVPWTANDPATIRALIALRVDGIISDRPDILQTVLKEEAVAHPADTAYFASFDVAAHRGGRGLRPENTLPSFESGLDHLATTLETDTGVTTDHVSLIWHDQFLNPLSCRHADGTLYTLANRTFIRDISSAEAQRTFICDKLRTGSYPAGVQTNDLSLSPVAVAFAKKERLISPYVPTYVEQLFRFVASYADYYRSGPGKSNPQAAARAANADRVRFNIETKILPLPNDPPGATAGNLPLPKPGAEPATNHTVDPQTFVTALCGAIARNHLESRVEVQSFDFRTLLLVEEQFPKIPTYYLTGNPESLRSSLLPPSLRQP